MKITCGACHASYNLPDEKVAGRRVKVRCKRCSEPIVVDGAQLPSIPAPPPDFEDEATRVMDSPLAGNANMWTVNLSETEQGDMTDEELVAGWQAGIVTEDAYVWRDGMDDWKPILDVPELVSLLSQATRVEPSSPEQEPVSAQPEPAGWPQEPAAARSPAPPVAHAKGLGSSPFAGPSLGAGSQLGSSQLGGAPSPLGAGPAVPGPAVPGPAVPRPPGARSNADLFTQKPKREKPKYEASEARNENSVLFSLDALKAAAAATTSDAPPKSNRVDENLLTMGLGGNDLFNAPLIQVETAPPQAQLAQRGASVGPAAAASIAPDGISPVKQGGGKGWFVAAVLVVLLGGAGMFMYGSNLEPDATIPTATPSVAPPSETAAAKEAAEEVKPADTAEPSDVEKDKGEDKGSEGTKEAARSNGSDKPPSDRPASDKPPSDTPASDTPKPPTGGGTPPSREKEEEKEEEKETSDAPPFNTEAARAALAGAASQAASCKAADGPTGTGKVQVTFVSSGRVTSAQVVSGPFGGTAVGGCVARTFRQARVPAFSGDSQTVSKSFSID